METRVLSIKIRGRESALRAIWLSLSTEERFIHIAEGRRINTLTLGDVARVRSALRECIAAGNPS